ncbi:MAG: hypothetical protein LBD45_08825 [Bacteroidales bacterium]|jgi:hypothetical protein|nr:hypothetical protein [Bacteroidales bacterium]
MNKNVLQNLSAQKYKKFPHFAGFSARKDIKNIKHQCLWSSEVVSGLQPFQLNSVVALKKNKKIKKAPKFAWRKKKDVLLEIQKITKKANY